jgi:hypothetical protein
VSLVCLANAALDVTASADGTLSATSTKFGGRLVAQPQQSPMKLYLDAGKERQDLATVFQGTLQHAADGKSDVKIARGKKIPVSPSSLERELTSGARVLALVPESSNEASAIFPVDGR